MKNVSWEYNRLNNINKIEKRHLWVRPIEWLKLNFASCVVHQARSLDVLILCFIYNVFLWTKPTIWLLILSFKKINRSRVFFIISDRVVLSYKRKAKPPRRPVREKRGTNLKQEKVGQAGFLVPAFFLLLLVFLLFYCVPYFVAVSLWHFSWPPSMMIWCHTTSSASGLIFS